MDAFSIKSKRSSDSQAAPPLPSRNLNEQSITRKPYSKASRNYGTARNKLKEFYSLNNHSEEKVKVPKERDINDINLDSFDGKKYIQQILSKKSLMELLLQANSFSTDVGNLDSDMKTLVYENYNKFIHATETLGEMKSNAESMEAQMQLLSEKINKISRLGNQIEDSISARRVEIRSLTNTIELETEIKEITEMPEKLYSFVVYKQYDKAIKLWSRTIPLLKNHSKLEKLLHVGKDYDSTLKEVEAVLFSRWGDVSTSISDAIQCSLLLTQMVPSKANMLWKDYLELQELRLENQRDLWARNANSCVPEQGVILKYLEDWSVVLSGFIDQFLAPDMCSAADTSHSDFHLEKSHNDSKNTTSNSDGLNESKQTTKSRFELGKKAQVVSQKGLASGQGYNNWVYGWQIMSRDDGVLAHRLFSELSERLALDFEDTQSLFLTIKPDRFYDYDAYLKHLDTFTEAVNNYPVLLKFGGLKSCVGRTIRRYYECLFSDIFQQIIFQIFNKALEYSSKGAFDEDGICTLFHGDISRIEHMYYISKNPLKPFDFITVLERFIINETENRLMPLIAKVSSHYLSSSTNTNENSLTLEKTVESANIPNFLSQLRIFISILNGQLDKFFRDFLPIAISVSFNIELNTDNKNTQAAINRLNIDKHFIEKIPLIENPAAYLIFARLCFNLNNYLIKQVFDMCEQALYPQSSNELSNFDDNLSLNNPISADLASNKSTLSQLDRSPIIYNTSINAQHLKFDENSLCLLFSRVSETLILQFIKITGSDFIHLYKQMLPQTLQLFDSNANIHSGSLYSSWLLENSQVLNLFHSIKTVPKTYVESANQPLDATTSANSISASIFMTRKWFAIVEDLLLNLFEDQVLYSTIQSLKVKHSNAGRLNSAQDSSSPLPPSFGPNFHQKKQPAKTMSLAKHSPLLLSQDLLTNAHESLGIYKNSFASHTNSPALSNPNSSSNFANADSTLLHKINQLFTAKVDVYLNHLNDLYPSNVLHGLSIVFVKGLVEIWRSSFINLNMTSRTIDVLSVNFKQFSHLIIDITFLKLFLNNYYQSINIYSQNKSLNSNLKKSPPSLHSLQSKTFSNSNFNSNHFSKGQNTRSPTLSLTKNSTTNVIPKKINSLLYPKSNRPRTLSISTYNINPQSSSSITDSPRKTKSIRNNIISSNSNSKDVIEDLARYNNKSQPGSLNNSLKFQNQGHLSSLFHRASHSANVLPAEFDQNDALYILIDDLSLAIINRYSDEIDYRYAYDIEKTGLDFQSLAYTSFVKFL